ncbi:MAG: FAD-dependent oxidoreductase [Thermoleophilia bacterium]|nr:FAD-dependent oxidoreductase [Thermoleophilia bacterium]
MTSDTTPRGDDVIVIGAGLAGLACAHRLAARGRTVRVLEAGRSPGGRARTEWHEGRPVDLGFQVLLGRYPAARALVRELGIPRHDMRAFSGGAAFWNGTGWNRLAPTPPSLARFGGLAPGDRLRLARLAAEVLRRPAEHWLDDPAAGRTTEEDLRAAGFGDAAIEGFFRPFWGVVFLDRSLSADAGYFRFLLGSLLRGPAVLPADGLGMIAEWAAAAIRQRGGHVELGVRVSEIVRGDDGGASGVRTADGRTLPARAVVVATEAPATRELLEPVDPDTARRVPAGAAAGVVTAAFALARPLYRGRVILVNADREDAGTPRVDLMCQTTNVTRPEAVGGPHILLASSVTTPGPADGSGLAEAVGRTVARWSPGYAWAAHAELIGVTAHEFAQYRPAPGVRDDLPGTRTRVPRLLVAGDLTTHPSIEGAVRSGGAAADALLAAPA